MVSANPFSIDQKFQTTTNTTSTLVNGQISSGANKVVLDSLTGLGVGTAIRFAGDSDQPTTHYITAINPDGDNALEISFTPAVDETIENDSRVYVDTGYYSDAASVSTLKNLTEIRINTALNAGDSISIIDAALDKVAQMRSDLGAIENRLAYTVSNLMNIAEKTADARSRLDDADYALESARLAKAQVVQQAGTSMLAQANQMTQLVLDLLRG